MNEKIGLICKYDFFKVNRSPDSSDLNDPFYQDVYSIIKESVSKAIKRSLIQTFDTASFKLKTEVFS